MQKFYTNLESNNFQIVNLQKYLFWGDAMAMMIQEI